MARACSDCSASITAQSKTGRCRPCAARRSGSDPAIIARRSAAWKRRMASDPAFRAKCAREIHCRHRAARRDPVKAAKLRQVIMENRKHLTRPGTREKWLAGRAAAGRKRHETVMAWCPVEYRDEYRYLRLSKKLCAADAKAAILAKLTPFDRQMLAVRNGARLIAKPVYRRIDPDRTLGGVTEALI